MSVRPEEIFLIVQNIGNGNDPGAPGSREVPNISNVIASRYTGDFSYNALQSKLEKRFSKGLSILSSYTFAKAIDNTPGGFCLSGGGQRNCGPDNPLNIDLDRGLSDTDIRHRFTLASLYDLPIGRNRTYFKDMPAALDLLVGGWQFNTIVTLQSGPVYDVTVNGGRVDPDRRSDTDRGSKSAGNSIKPRGFSCGNYSGFCQRSELDRNSEVSDADVFRGDFQEYWDAGLFKNVPLRFINEQSEIQMRISVFNVLNHVNRGRPNGDLNSDNFGKDNNEQRRRQLEFGLRFVF